MEREREKPTGIGWGQGWGGVRVYCLDLIRPGNCCERQWCLRDTCNLCLSACDCSKVSFIGGGGRLLNMTSLLLLLLTTLGRLGVSISLPIGPLDEIQLELLFSLPVKESFSLLSQTLTLADINAHPHTELSLLGLSYYLTEHQQILLSFFFFSSVPSSQWRE